jgi:hypothetical protein
LVLVDQADVMLRQLIKQPILLPVKACLRMYDFVELNIDVQILHKPMVQYKMDTFIGVFTATSNVRTVTGELINKTFMDFGMN